MDTSGDNTRSTTVQSMTAGETAQSKPKSGSDKWFEQQASIKIDRAIHFWVEDHFDILVITDNLRTNEEYWYGDVTIKVQDHIEAGETHKLTVTAIRKLKSECLELVLGDDIYADITSEVLFMCLYFDLIQNRLR